MVLICALVLNILGYSLLVANHKVLVAELLVPKAGDDRTTLSDVEAISSKFSLG